MTGTSNGRPAGASDSSSAFEAVRCAVAEFLDSQLVPLGELARRIVDAVPADAAERDRGVLTERELAAFVPGIEAVLADSDVMVGHGFVAAPWVVAARERHLLWLQRRTGGISRLVVNLDPSDPDLYDYLDMEWYTRAQRLLTPVVYGPYLDYSGSDHFVLTVTVPVLIGTRFLGVTGADLLMDRVEGRLVEQLRTVPGETLIVNGDRAVVASTSARWLPGERLAESPSRESPDYAHVATLGDWSGWVLAVGSR